jgi:hypothetical protein
MHQGKRGREKFFGTLAAPLRQVGSRNKYVRFVNQVAERLHVSVAVVHWHGSRVRR